MVWVVTPPAPSPAPITRRYHGFLIAALPAPLGRMVMWSHVSEFLRFRDDDDVVSFGAEERAGGQLDLRARIICGSSVSKTACRSGPISVRDLVLEKRVLLPHLQNTVHVSYRVLEGEHVRGWSCGPRFNFRHHETPVNKGLAAPYKLTAVEAATRSRRRRAQFPPLRMQLYDCEAGIHHCRREYSSGRLSDRNKAAATHRRRLWSPGFFHVDLRTNTNRHTRRFHREMGNHRVLNPPQALAAERERRARLLDEAAPEARDRGRRRA